MHQNVRSVIKETKLLESDRVTSSGENVSLFLPSVCQQMLNSKIEEWIMQLEFINELAYPPVYEASWNNSETCWRLEREISTHGYTVKIVLLLSLKNLIVTLGLTKFFILFLI
jgi:hypothetical protein